MVPDNNITDNDMEAWNDTFSSFDVSSDDSHVLLLVPSAATPSALNEEVQSVVTLTVAMHNQGLQFGLSTQGNDLINLLLADPIPRQQLNSMIFHALRLRLLLLALGAPVLG